LAPGTCWPWRGGLKVITTQNALSPALVWRRLPVTRRRRIAVLIGQMARRQLVEQPEAPGRPGHEPSDAAVGQDHRPPSWPGSHCL